MSDKDFPSTVFVTYLPDEYTLVELTELLESFGSIMEIERMNDGHVRVRFQDGKAAKKCFVQAKKGALTLKDCTLGIMPKKSKE